MTSFSTDAMSPEQWTRILELFHATLNQSRGDRETFLRTACGDDPNLYTYVSALIAVDGAQHTLLDADEGVWTTVVGEAGMTVGQTIGPYRLETELGRGGMGVVYRARREDVGTTVAIKFLRDRFPSDIRLQRFLREQRILGRLNHPGIARLLDAGTVEDGTPFFVMEYADGVPIPDYCYAHDLDVRERVQLFLDICDAVAYAHQALVIHRDLKPSNVLVTADGRIKLLDFGIAKLLDDGEGLTRTSEHLLTPAYAAPEQINGAAISTRTDVYALGALLYQILTAHPPVPIQDVSFAEMVERVLRGTVSAPSEASTTERGGLPASVLRGDLDTICLTGLAKNPSDRYASVHDMSDDLRRHLNHRPILARTRTVRDRALKFTQRNRDRLLATTLVVLLFSALVVFYTIQLRTERNHARQAAEKAEQATTFVSGFVEAPRLDNTADTLRALMLLRRGEKQIDTLTEQPLVQAQMLSVIGSIYTRLGRYGDAGPLLRRAIDTYRTAGAALTTDAVATRRAVGEPLMDRSHIDEAETILRNAVRERERLHDTSPHEYAASLALLGSGLPATGNDTQANQVQQDVLHMRTRLLGPTRRDVTLTQQALAAILAHQGEMDSAEALYRDALKTLKAAIRSGQASQINLADLLQDYATHINDQGRHREAEQMHRDAFRIRRSILGLDHPETVISLSYIGAALHSQGRYTESRAYARRVVAFREQMYGPMHIRLATSLHQLANNEVQLERYREAEPLFRRVIDIYTERVGPEHWYVGVAIADLAGALRGAGRLDEAVNEHRRALAIFRNALGDDHWQTAFCEAQTARTLTEARKYDEAHQLFEKSYRTMLDQLGPTHSLTLMAAEVGMQLHALWRGPDAAVALASRAAADGLPRATLDSLASAPPSASEPPKGT